MLDPPTAPATVSSLELCPLTDDPNHIALYGAVTNLGNSRQQTWTLNPSTFSNSPDDYSTNAGNCAAGAYGGSVASWCVLAQPPPPGSGPTTSPIDGKVAAADCSAGGTCNGNTAVVTVKGFDWSAGALGIPAAQQNDIPAGLRIDSIEVRVSHSEPNGITPEPIIVNVPVQGTNKTCTATPTSAPGPSLKDETLLCTNPSGGGLIGQLTKTAGGQDFSGSLEVTYGVHAQPKSGITGSQLDGIQVIIKATPFVVPQSACAIDGTCSFLVNNAGAQGRMGIWGTLYAPNAYLGIGSSPFSFASSTNIVFNMGVIVKSLNVSGLPATDTTGRFRLGDGSGRTVELISNPSAAVRVRTIVRVVDSATASPHGFLAVVRQWSTAKP
jgi:hypothetical protein